MSSIDKIYCLKFIKLPPASVVVGSPFDIAVSITDDVGSEIPGYGKIVKFSCYIDAEKSVESPDVVVLVARTNSSSIEIDSYGTLFHNFKVTIVPKRKIPKGYTDEVHLAVSLEPHSGRAIDRLQKDHMAVLRLAQESRYLHLEEYEENVAILRTLTGPLSLELSPGKRHTGTKVEATQVILRIDGKPCQTIKIMERPSLHAIGDRLWHSSIVMSSYLLHDSLRSHHLLGQQKPVCILELGAGCGLVSLAAAHVLKSLASHNARIIATDTPEVVDSTLQESILANPSLSIWIEGRPLIWGQSAESRAVNPRPDEELLVLAADVLYNSESHQDFLSTLLALLGTWPMSVESIIAYKPRVQGDGDFFELARDAGLQFVRIHAIADVQLWQLKRPAS